MIVGKRQVKAEEEVGSRSRLSALNMYSTPPAETLSLIEFETFARDRLRCARAKIFLSLRPFLFFPASSPGRQRRRKTGRWLTLLLLGRVFRVQC